jgi:hypothetical protein
MTGPSPTISLTCIETRHVDKAVHAVKSTLACTPATSLYWFGTAPFPDSLPGITIHNVRIRDFVNFMDDINELCLVHIPRIVASDFNIIIQADGYALNAAAWTPDFLDYDYIGAVWPWLENAPYWKLPVVGNGGFSLRSRKLYAALTDLQPNWRSTAWQADPRFAHPFYTAIRPDGTRWVPEDTLICLWHADILREKYRIRFAPPELANRFSVETKHPFTEYWIGKSLGFHNKYVAHLYGVTL